MSNRFDLDAPGSPYALIPLTNGGTAEVDGEDYAALAAHSWNRNSRGHARRSIRVGSKVVTLLMHREIMKVGPGVQVDHKDHDKLNNRKENLRPATNTTNQQNSRKKAPASSVFKGVDFNRAMGKWRARIAVNGSRLHLGYFTSEVAAAAAYNSAAAAHFGEFACLNLVVSL